MIAALIKELGDRAHELEGVTMDSIYFGGGTPSVLTYDDLQRIMSAIADGYQWHAAAEITLEANPDDITEVKVRDYLRAGVNRFSVGVQSFDEADLTFMNRAHDALEAQQCIQLIKDVGCDVITADLIYGSPTTSTSTWVSNIEQLLQYDLPHISAYCLTVEEGTALHHFVKTGAAQPVDQDRAIEHFDILMDCLVAAGYEHYEISNFAKPGARAIHNTNYWKGAPYVGIGPGAHTYDGESTRRWNIANNAQYIKAVNDGDTYHEQEVLTATNKYNEYVLTALRTSWGISEEKLQSEYGDCWTSVRQVGLQLVNDGMLSYDGKAYTLTRAGKHMADHVSMQLFCD